MSTPSNTSDGPAAPPPSKPREAWATATPIRGGAEDTLGHEGVERGGSFGEERVGGEEMNHLLRPYDTTENSKTGLMLVCVCVCVCVCMLEQCV